MLSSKGIYYYLGIIVFFLFASPIYSGDSIEVAPLRSRPIHQIRPAAKNVFAPLFPSPLPTTNYDNINENIVNGKMEQYLEKVREVRGVIQKARDLGNFLGKLDGSEDLVSLPLVMEVGDPEGSYAATIVIEEIKIRQNYMQLYVILAVEAPFLGDQPLIFYSPDVKYSAQTGIIGEATLALYTDYALPVFDTKAAVVFREGNYDPYNDITTGTFARIGCDGLESLSIAGSVYFSQDWMIPVVEEVHEVRSRVVADFAIQDITDPSEIFLDLDIGRFELKGLPDFNWEINQLTFDLSEDISPQFILNSGYEINYYTKAGIKTHTLLESGKLWKGFYAREVSVSLPKALAGEKEINFTIQDLIIDDTGFSGYARVDSDTSLIAFGESNVGGWAFSIDAFELLVTESSNWAVQFDGLMYVPVFSGEDDRPESGAIWYEATIDPENGYLFTSGPAESKDMDLWVATAEIFPSTEITLGYRPTTKSFMAKAVIDADISISKSGGENAINVELPTLEVRKLTLQTEGPPIIMNLDQWSLASNAPVNVGIFKIGFDTGDSTKYTGKTGLHPDGKPAANLDLNAFVELSAVEGLKGYGGFQIEGEMIDTNGYQKWVNKDFRLKEMKVSAGEIIPGIDYLEGSLLWYDNHDHYGKGFRGELTIGIKGIIREVKSVAQFGSVVDKEVDKGYFMIDASAMFGFGIPVGGGLSIRGFGGGFYSNMSRPEAAGAFADLKEEQLTDSFLHSSIGESMSGVKYTVAPGESLGFKALVMMSTPPVNLVDGNGDIIDGELSLFNASLEFGMEFDKCDDCESMGLQSVYFQGVGNILSGADLSSAIKKVLPDKMVDNLENIAMDELGFSQERKRPRVSTMPNPLAPVSALVLMQLNLDCPEFHALLGVYINAGILYGKAEADLRIKRNCDQLPEDPNILWHIFLGRLNDPMALGMDIPILGELVRISAYMMAGNEGIPTDLPPPQAYVDNFGSDLLNAAHGGYPGGSYPHPAEANRGKGFATGMSIEVGTPPEGLQFLFLYATLRGGLGFDFILSKMQGGECFDDVGINGWYGKGQAWLYAQAAIGAQLKLGFLNFRFQVFDAATGAMLRVEGPDPFYGMGRLDARLNLLGLLSTSVKFKVKIGSSLRESLPQECASNISPLEVPIIEDVYPEATTSNGTYPSSTSLIVDLNYNVDAPFADPDHPDKQYQIFFPFVQQIKIAGDKKEDPTNEDITIGLLDDEHPSTGNNAPPVNITLSFDQVFTILDETGREIPFTYSRYNNDYGATSFRVTPNEPLPGNSKIFVRALAYIAEIDKKAYNLPEDKNEEILTYREYNIVKDFREDQRYNFNIAPEAEDFEIFPEDVDYSYPIEGMRNFYINEGDEMPYVDYLFRPAYQVTLRHQKSFLLENIPSGYKAFGRIKDSGGKIIGDLMRLERKSFGKREMYYFEKNPYLENNLEYVLEMVYLHQGEEDINPDFGLEKILFSLPFRTSQYDTFGEKLKALQYQYSEYIDVDQDNYTMGDIMNFHFVTSEPFDKTEMISGENGNESLSIRPLVNFHWSDQPSDMDWINDHPALSMIYQFYAGCFTEWIPPYMDLHPKNAISSSGTENQWIITSRLPAQMYMIQKEIYKRVATGRNISCSSLDHHTFNNILCKPELLLEEFCQPEFDFATDPIDSEFKVVFKYYIPIGEKTQKKTENEEEKMFFNSYVLDVKLEGDE